MRTRRVTLATLLPVFLVLVTVPAAPARAAVSPPAPVVSATC
ncbi:hypothetical protein ACFY19_28690 [Streptosporangium saharense]